MTEQWQELKETIIELRDNDGAGTQQEVCKFLANLMNVLEKQMKEDKEERLKMLMETGEFDFLKDIPPDKIWKLVFMLEFIGNTESEE